MTQPPDDAALVARLKADITLWGTPNSLSAEAATALEAKDRRIAELEALLRALESANDAVAAGRSQAVYVAMIDSGQTDALAALDDARRAARAALEPSDKGVGNVPPQ